MYRPKRHHFLSSARILIIEIKWNNAKYGNDNYILAGPIPLRIREARVPIVNDNECVRKINSVTEKIFILPASSFCAGGEKGHDACQVKIFSFSEVV